MSGDYPYTVRIISPVKCNEKPWDLWVSEIGHSSPRRDQDVEETRLKPGRIRRRHAGINRLHKDTMNLYGLLPHSDNLYAAVCHMCGVTVKCSAAHRHLLSSHACSDPILPPPPPTVKLKSSHSRSRHKKELLPPPSVDMLPNKLDSSPMLTATTPFSRLLPPPDAVPYLDEASNSTGVSGEVQVHVESGELPVVSIQDTAELPLGENMTDDIFEIMNSEGIQTAEDSTNWNNIIKDINMQDLNFQPPDSVHSQDLYAPVDPNSMTYTISESDLTSLQMAPSSSTMLTNVDSKPPTIINAQVPKPAPVAVVAPLTKSQSRSKSSKTKIYLREYDPNKHCGVVTEENGKPCTRSLTCKVHALSLRRLVDGRIKPFDMLLAEHRAAKDPTKNASANAVTTVHTTHPATPVELANINGLITDSQVSDLYATLLGVEEPVTIPEPTVSHVPVVAAPVIETPIQDRREEAPSVAPNDVCWYTSSPRPLALCTFNASHAGGAITLGKKFATVRSNIKSSLSRSQSKSTAGSSSNYFFGQSPVSWSKSIHMNNVRQKPEVRRVVVRCAATSGRGSVEPGRDVRLNGHVSHVAALKSRPLLDLGFGLDPLLADDKC